MKRHLLLASALFGAFFAHASTQLFVDYKSILETIYKDISGYGIPQKETDLIKNEGGDPTYGQITYEGAAVLLDHLAIDEDTVFYDLGSGTGAFVWQAYLTTPAKKCVGVELSETRFKHAKSTEHYATDLAPSCFKFEAEMHSKLKLGKIAWPAKKVMQFRQENMVKTDIKDARVIFMCATCFPESLMKTMTERFAELKDGLRIATLKQLTPHEDIYLEQTLTLPMTWSKNSPVYIYVVDRERKKHTKDTSSEECAVKHEAAASPDLASLLDEEIDEDVADED